MPKLFDTHAHYYDPKFNADRKEVLDRLFSNDIIGIMCCGDNIEHSIDSIKLSLEYKNMFASCGIHPEECEKYSDVYSGISSLLPLLNEEKVRAVGEIGLDYYWDTDRNTQKIFFDAQLSLAEELNLPVIIHDRDAHQDTLDIIKSHKNVYGIMHCYSGSTDFAKEYLKHNFYISFGGPLTYKSNTKTVEVAKNVPLDRILIETDAPYLPPVPHRGERNDSGFMHHVAEKICEIHNLDYDEFCEIEVNNSKTIFSIYDL